MSVIQIASGRLFDFTDPDSTPLTIKEISHALSRLCRFTGHVQGNKIYSVAQHSVLCALYAPPGLRLQALMHDAAESVLGDVSSPLKALLPDYKALERRVEDSIAKTFGLPLTLDPEIKKIDLRMLATERRDLHGPCVDERVWDFLPEPYADRINVWDIDEAESNFRVMFYSITKSREEHANAASEFIKQDPDNVYRVQRASRLGDDVSGMGIAVQTLV